VKPLSWYLEKVQKGTLLSEWSRPPKWVLHYESELLDAGIIIQSEHIRGEKKVWYLDDKTQTSFGSNNLDLHIRDYLVKNKEAKE
jgi:hypothetical protein